MRHRNMFVLLNIRFDIRGQLLACVHYTVFLVVLTILLRARDTFNVMSC